MSDREIIDQIKRGIDEAIEKLPESVSIGYPDEVQIDDRVVIFTTSENEH